VDTTVDEREVVVKTEVAEVEADDCVEEDVLIDSELCDWPGTRATAK
jgi:hypothetical protein